MAISFFMLIHLNRPDKNHPIENTMEVLKELVKYVFHPWFLHLFFLCWLRYREGKIRYIGISECSAATLRRAHAIYPIEAMQIEYSPFCLDAEGAGVITAARELGVKIVAYSPLGRGMLTGRYVSLCSSNPSSCVFIYLFDGVEITRWFWREWFQALHTQVRPDSPLSFILVMFAHTSYRHRFTGENFPRILALVKKLGEIGEKHNATSGQVTLAWLLAQGIDVLPIPGTSKLKVSRL